MKAPTSKIGEVYAWALFELARDANLIDAVNEDLSSIGELAHAQPDFLAFVASPYFTLDAKSGLLRSIFSGRITELTLDFLMVVARRGRLAWLDDMASEYERFWDAHNGYTTVHVTLAKPLDGSEIQRLNDEIAAAMASKIRLQTTFDDSILGGVIIRHGDELIDNSARSMLERAVKQITSRRKKAERINEV